MPDDLMLTSKQLKHLYDSGMEIGAHTVQHPILFSVDAREARKEIETSRADIESIIGSPVTLFAYPNGKPSIDYSQRDVDLVRELGFEAAVSTAWGVGTAGADRWQLPRFTPWDRSRFRFVLRLIDNYRRTSPLVT